MMEQMENDGGSGEWWRKWRMVEEVEIGLVKEVENEGGKWGIMEKFGECGNEVGDGEGVDNEGGVLHNYIWDVFTSYLLFEQIRPQIMWGSV